MELGIHGQSQTRCFLVSCFHASGHINFDKYERRHEIISSALTSSFSYDLAVEVTQLLRGKKQLLFLIFYQRNRPQPTYTGS